jgi:hypothetical protein
VTVRLLRFARRRAAWESPSPEYIRDVEFRDREGKADLRPSMYFVEEKEILRCYAEHAAAIPIDPPRSALVVFGEACAGDKIREEAGSEKFIFIRERHREVHVIDEAGLTGFVTCLLDSVKNERAEVGLKDVVAYAQQRLLARDGEWLAVVMAPDAKPWMTKLKT